MPLNKPPIHFDLLDFFTQDNPLLQFTFDTLPVPIFCKDINGIYLDCNRTFEEFIKISRQELIGHSVYELFDKALADAYQQADQQLFDNPGVQIYEKQIRTNLGDTVFVKFHKTSFCDEKGNVAGLIGVIFDITEQKEIEQKLIKNATFDTLTGFYNRRHGTEIAMEKMALAIKKEIQFAIVMIDIDHFKRVNDQYGHSAGDTALQHLSAIIEQLIEPEEAVVRWGGEEFLILISAPIEQKKFRRKIIERANYLRESIFSKPIFLEQNTLTLTVSCGVSCYAGQSLRELINEADALLYQAKHQGRNQVCG